MLDVKEKIKIKDILQTLNEAEVSRFTSGLISKETYVHDVTFLIDLVDKLTELIEYNQANSGTPFDWF